MLDQLLFRIFVSPFELQKDLALSRILLRIDKEDLAKASAGHTSIVLHEVAFLFGAVGGKQREPHAQITNGDIVRIDAAVKSGEEVADFCHFRK